VLRSRSLYFDKSLDGEWAEAAARRVELTVLDQQAVEDLKLLIKLSYSDSYVLADGEKLLPLDSRLRLAVRADSLEFVEAADQIVESLPLELGFEGAIKCQELPPMLEQHAGIGAARKQVVALLAKGIEEREGKEEDGEAVAAGVEALAKLLGPVAGMFEKGPGRGDLPLREEVKELPVCVLKRLLGSEALQLQSENEAFALAVAWVKQSELCPEDDKQQVFEQLVPLLRYHHMTPDFLAIVVSDCVYLQSSDLLLPVLRAAMYQRNVSVKLLDEKEVGRGGRDRSVPPAEAVWEVSASFTLEEVAALERGSGSRKWCGLVAGYEAVFSVRRHNSEDEDALSFYFGLDLPVPTDYKLEGGPQAGVGLMVDMTVTPNVSHVRTCY
jgi:hypothetical protein